MEQHEIFEVWPYNLAMQVLGSEEEVKQINAEAFLKVLATLDKREQDIVRQRVKHNKTLEELGKMYGVTRERVRQIQEDAYAKLRHSSNKRHYICVTLAEHQKICNELAMRNKEFALLAEKLQQFEKEAKVSEGKTVAEHLLGLEMPIEKLSLTNRAYNALHCAGITTVGALIKYSYAELSELRSIGQNSVDNIVHALYEKGYKLKVAD